MNIQHTPGPWNSVATLSSDLYNIRYISGPDCENVATIKQEAGLAQDIALANARLIAAAPELLKALQEVVAISDRKHDAWDRAHAAIAKATT